ncbi:hypothetical protein [Acinetobacter sp. ANC 4648]|uniref:hypothetical protein n=1 Tax=Acinetobacter sp. ANC 4648 TaxID=1977875 RepID=UPI000A32F8EE|nr:hypothetical protein [Acinetobacter sp. ANC 4648]OTG83801.1 hypothetical protein B9T27_04655 [Acinetobacter sp. ANC 4648]
MAKLMLLSLLIITIFLLWRFIFKPKMNRDFSLNLDERSKSLGAFEPVIVSEAKPLFEKANKEEQCCFDAVAQLFFEQKIKRKNIENAEQIQANFLNKMPAPTLSQIGEFDLGEWCIYWTYKDQSLEYYVGRYGVFCTHVDRYGTEHKLESKYANNYSD